MIRNLIPFGKLTRSSMPQFAVARVPMVTLGQTLQVGELYPVAQLGTSPVRLRQLYEQRRITPVQSVTVNMSSTKPPTPVGTTVVSATDGSAAKVSVGVSALPFPSVSVPVPVNVVPTGGGSGGGYTPSRRQGRGTPSSTRNRKP